MSEEERQRVINFLKSKLKISDMNFVVLQDGDGYGIWRLEGPHWIKQSQAFFDELIDSVSQSTKGNNNEPN